MKLGKNLLMSSLILGSMFAASIATLAANNGGEYKSNGVIEYVPSTDPTDPVDPTDPEKPVDPTDPTNPEGPNPGTNGPLSIDFASSFYFGKQKITSQNETYHADAQSYQILGADGKPTGDVKKGPNYVQITDNRGTETGWTLKVKQDGQFLSEGKHAEDKQAELTGAQLVLNNGHVVTNSASAKPTGTAKITLDPTGAEADVMVAKDKEGAGTYLLDWGTDEATGGQSVDLTVPGSTTKYAEKYATKLVWTLTDVPGNGSTTPKS